MRRRSASSRARAPPIVRSARRRCCAAMREANPGPLPSDAVTGDIPPGDVGLPCARAADCAIAYLGPAGTFSHAAVGRHFGEFVDAEPCASIDEVFRAAESGQTDYAVVPVENSTEGAVGRTLDLMCQTTLTIVGEIRLRIQQNLLAKAIATRRGHARSIRTRSRCRSACIGSRAICLPCRAFRWRATPKRHGSRRPSPAPLRSPARPPPRSTRLDVLAAHIEDEPNNTTRFWVLGRHAVARSGDDETSLVMSAQNRPGAVHALLEPLARHGVSMNRLRIASGAHRPVGVPVLRRPRRPSRRCTGGCGAGRARRARTVSQAARLVPGRPI